MRPKDADRLLGAWGETVAANYLREKKMEIVAVNFHSRYGELDIVARDGDMLVAVEVKTRRSEAFARPMESVTPQKLQRMKLTAAAYLQSRNLDIPMRFDVVEVYAPQSLAAPPRKIVHLKNVYMEMN